MGRHHNRGWRAIPERNIVRLWNKFDGERFRGYVKVNNEIISCGIQPTRERAVMARRLAIHWIKSGYDLDRVYCER